MLRVAAAASALAACGGGRGRVGGVWRRQQQRRRCAVASDSGGGGGSPQHVRARKRGRWDAARDAPVGERRERSRPLADTTKCRALSAQVKPFRFRVSYYTVASGLVSKQSLMFLKSPPNPGWKTKAVSDVLKVTSKSRLKAV